MSVKIPSKAAEVIKKKREKEGDPGVPLNAFITHTP